MITPDLELFKSARTPTMIRYYKELNDEEKLIAIRRIANRVKTSEKSILEVLNNVNPLLTIKNGEVIMFYKTFVRLKMKIKEYKRKT